MTYLKLLALGTALSSFAPLENVESHLPSDQEKPITTIQEKSITTKYFGITLCSTHVLQNAGNTMEERLISILVGYSHANTKDLKPALSLYGQSLKPFQSKAMRIGKEKIFFTRYLLNSSKIEEGIVPEFKFNDEVFKMKLPSDNISYAHFEGTENLDDLQKSDVIIFGGGLLNTEVKSSHVFSEREAQEFRSALRDGVSLSEELEEHILDAKAKRVLAFFEENRELSTTTPILWNLSTHDIFKYAIDYSTDEQYKNSPAVHSIAGMSLRLFKFFGLHEIDNNLHSLGFVTGENFARLISITPKTSVLFMDAASQISQTFPDALTTLRCDILLKEHAPQNLLVVAPSITPVLVGEFAKATTDTNESNNTIGLRNAIEAYLSNRKWLFKESELDVQKESTVERISVQNWKFMLNFYQRLRASCSNIAILSDDTDFGFQFNFHGIHSFDVAKLNTETGPQMPISRKISFVINGEEFSGKPSEKEQESIITFSNGVPASNKSCSMM